MYKALGWEKVRLGDVCEITSSKRIFAHEYVSFGIPFYRSKEIIEKQKGNEISTALYISNDKYDEIKSKFFVPLTGDMLLTSVGTLGVPYVIKENEVFYFKDGNLTWFKNWKNIFNRFIYYWFLSVGKNQIDSKCIGSTQKALTIDTLKQFEIFLPPLPEQKRIANILSSLDDKIDLNNRINKNLEAQAQAIFKSWFVDFEPFLEGEFEDSELGRIPKGWRVGTLGEIATITMGQSPKGDTYNESGNGKVFYQGRAEFGARFPKRRLFTTAPNRMASENDVLLSVRAPVGDYNIATESCCIGRGLASIKPLHQTYSYCICLMTELQPTFRQFNAEGTVFGSINKDSLNGIGVIIPDDNTLMKFEKLVSTLNHQIRFNYNNTQTLAALRDVLLPKLMSGEVRVQMEA